ncbi:unnamed protein product [Candida verbasci]|uniref:Translation initiation factor IF-2, mitochondrial n=1 Tax=Candida verbasci TaxID=1227364 RepID=A0A9W4TXK5_9ASCO|nr:unnamed protein product [Candida verbasci]
MINRCLRLPRCNLQRRSYSDVLKKPNRFAEQFKNKGNEGSNRFADQYNTNQKQQSSKNSSISNQAQNQGRENQSEVDNSQDSTNRFARQLENSPKTAQNENQNFTPRQDQNGSKDNQLKTEKPTNRFAKQYEISKQNQRALNNQSNVNKSEKPANRFAGQYDKSPKLDSKQTRFDQLKKQLNKTTAKPKVLKKQVKKKAKNRKIIKIHIPPVISVSNFAASMNVTLNELFKKLQGLGFEDIRHNYMLDKETAALVADEFDIEIDTSEQSKDDIFPDKVNESLLTERPPVVTIMGHVDHGKTTILDYLRKSSIVDKEFGGITQHIGAFSVTAPISKKKITFLDTPGHAAFLKMRERGAVITDIVILVVAGDDSVKPQTIEAIKHAKKSGVPMIVAINKCDKYGIKIDKVLSDLSANGVEIEDYGGDTQTVQVSGKTGLNMDKLEEAVITLSELSEFKAEPKGVAAEGWIIESEVVKGLGNVATVLVRRGSLKPGDFIVAGDTYCKIRAMKDEFNKPVKLATPSTPVQIMGWKTLPNSGESIIQAKNEQSAKKCIDYRIAKFQEIQSIRHIEDINKQRAEEIENAKKQEKINALKAAGLDTTELENKKEDLVKKCSYIIKSDVFGSAEAIKESIDGLGNEEVKSVVINHEAGPPSEGDVELAKTFNAKIFCFNVKVPRNIQMKADKDKVEIVEHNIIYRLIEEVTDDLCSHLAPRIETKITGEVDIKDVFTITAHQQKVKVAGCKVATGLITRNSNVKVLRKRQEIYKGTLSSLKYIKDDISEAKKGNECGLMFSKWSDFESGDKIQVYEEIEHKRFL